MSDLLSHGGDDERPPWRPPQWALSVAVVVVVGALVAGLLVLAAGGDGHPRAASASSPSATSGLDLPVLEVAPRDAVALLLPGRQGVTAERHDPWRDRGPWTVTVRRPDGSFGRHGAVVTFPVDELLLGRKVRVGRVKGRLDGRTLVWPIAGGYARVRGDLGTRTLLAIARNTTVSHDRPVVRAPDGLRVVGEGRYRPSLITEARYRFHDDDVSGLVTTGLIMSGGGFEDAVFAGPSVVPTTVRGRPAVATPIFGGNFAIVWEVRPGVVAYAGDSGMPLSEASVDALADLAGRAQLTGRTRWRATGPRMFDQVTHLDPSD